MSEKLTRETLEVLRDCDANKMACSECPPHKPPEQACYRFQYERGELAALALRLAEGLDKLQEQHGGCIVDPACEDCAVCRARSLLVELEG